MTAKWIAPLGGLLRIASTIFGWAWPTTFTPKPPWKSRVLGAVDVPDVRALARLQVHGVGVARLEVRSDARRQALQGALVERFSNAGVRSSRIFVSRSAISAARALSRSRSPRDITS